MEKLQAAVEVSDGPMEELGQRLLIDDGIGSCLPAQPRLGRGSNRDDQDAVLALRGYVETGMVRASVFWGNSHRLGCGRICRALLRNP